MGNNIKSGVGEKFLWEGKKSEFFYVFHNAVLDKRHVNAIK